MNFISNWMISMNFHYPTGKTKEYTQLRQEITDKYGLILTIIVAGIILLIPLKNYLQRCGFTFLNRFPLLRKINYNLNQNIYTSASLYSSNSRIKRFQSWYSSLIKSVIFTLTLHATTIIQVTFWSCLLCSLSLVELFNGDLIYLAKRLGRLCASCLTPVLFLSLRPLPLPNTLYLSLLPIHKWLSRLIIVQAVIHTCLYCGYFQKNNTWFKAWKYENIYGWVALGGFIIIIITSLLKVRNRWYKVFFFNHYVSSWVIVICLQIHVRPFKLTYYTILNVAILVGQIAYRFYLTSITVSKHDLKVIDISPNLSIIEFPNSLIKKNAVNPGAHIRLTKYHPSIFVNLYKQIVPNYHPYTLVSLPQDNYQKLIVRRSNFVFGSNQKYVVCGLYDPHLLFISSKNTSSSKFLLSKLTINAKRLLIVIGGSAISFALPLLRVMNYHGVPVKIVWVIRDFRDVLILKHFDGFIHGDDFEIFITGDNDRRLNGSISYASIKLTRSKPVVDLESDERSLLLDEIDDIASLNFENETENVEISVDQEEEIECVLDPQEEQELEAQDEQSISSDDPQSNVLGPTLSRAHTFTSMNEQYTFPNCTSDTSKNWVNQFKETVKSLNLEHKVYKGRPKLNYKYYNWCVNEGFTQCLGPVQDENLNFVCCRDLPKNRVRQEDINCEKIWVVAAGPQALVRNVKVWANEYGLKFHEEAFYV